VLDTVMVALLEQSGSVKSTASFQVGSLPRTPVVDRIDEDSLVDIAVPCVASSEVAVLLGTGGGGFASARKLPTLSGPTGLALDDLDLDGHVDMVVASKTGVCVHYGLGGGDFASVMILGGNSGSREAVAVVDLDQDGNADVIAGGSSGLHAWRGRGDREFDSPLEILPTERVFSLVVVDLDGDGRADITVTHDSGVAVILNRGAFTFAPAADYPMGFIPLGHRLADLDLDGALDLVAFQMSGAAILFGRSVSDAGLFRRGDVTDDGKIDLTDAVAVLLWLFLSGEPPSCLDAADSNHDGRHDLTAAVALLQYLFLGGQAPPAPGPTTCGPALEPSLGCEESSCAG
jgi:hypothetical protein